METVWIIILSILGAGVGIEITLPSSYESKTQCEIAARMIVNQKESDRHRTVYAHCHPMLVKK